jgi:hypothetical protein
VIVASIVLVGAAAALLVAGLAWHEPIPLYLSIVASALAALAVVVGVRLLSSGREDDDAEPKNRSRKVGGGLPQSAARAIGVAEAPSTAADPTVTALISAAATKAPDAGLVPAAPAARSGDPPDEPPVQVVSASDADRVARLRAEVVVIDGRPRYHLSDCVQLLGRSQERLPVSEAVELGFTPCRDCAPVTTLLSA